MKQTNTPLTKHQQGSALLVSLIILVVMTLLGLSGMRTSVMEEKMAGNMRDSELAFQAAEAALRDAEKYIKDNKIDLPMITVLTPLPGTNMYKPYESQITIHDLDYYTLTNAVIPTKMKENDFFISIDSRSNFAFFSLYAFL